MHTPFKYLAILALIAQLPQLSLATWMPGKAAQINFYVGGTCAQYIDEATSWWTSSALVGGNGAVTGAECFILGMPGDSTGINTAMMWEENTTSNTVEPHQANGWCMFWDGFDCTGNEVSSVYAPAGAGGGPCESAWSKDGFMWKSAKCGLHRCNHRAGSTPSHAPEFDSNIDFGFDFHDPNHYPNTTIHYIFVNFPHFPNIAIQHIPLEVVPNANIDLIVSLLHHYIFLSIAARLFIQYLDELGICANAATINYSFYKKLPLLRHDRRRHSWCCFTGCSRHPTRVLYLASRTKETGGDPSIPGCVGTTRTGRHSAAPALSEKSRGSGVGTGARLAATLSDAGRTAPPSVPSRKRAPCAP
ncbi:hypothetical protein MVEN_02175500 [Mycena venus]|uniref:Uncharacterized protein n=1 Tax=Mycena venus TaxID=2733690 RepID=A0A8H6X8A2_9AGAR|nr:hypothetical protein MVEN_02175500 [Mycena venus]